MPSPDSVPSTVAVIGGGIVGLAVAREIAVRFPGSSVTVFERESTLAAHQTGHNSGVVHAGLYYAPGSLKASLCRRGSGQLREFCQDNSIPFRELGKLVVAADPGELAALAEIEQRALSNGVPDLHRLDRAGMAELEPHVAGVAALHSPRTAVVDYVRVCEVLADQVRAAGGQVLLNSPVTGITQSTDSVTVMANSESHSFDQVIACAGLFSDAVSDLLGSSDDLRIVPFRGEYFRLDHDAAKLVNGLVYPIPDPRYPFLGVHLTRSVNDEVFVGPNAVPALALAGYRWRDIDVADLWHFVAWSGFAHLAAQHWRSGVREFAGSVSKNVYASRVRRYLPAVQLQNLLPAAAGVRAQAVDSRGNLVDDFALRKVGRVLVVRNAPSPAATSSLAIAEHLVNEVWP